MRKVLRTFKVLRTGKAMKGRKESRQTVKCVARNRLPVLLSGIQPSLSCDYLSAFVHVNHCSGDAISMLS